MNFLWFLVIFLVTIAFGMPISSSMLVLSVIFCLFNGYSVPLLVSNMFTGMTSYVMMAIPLFILTAEVMDRTKVTDKLFKFCYDLVGYIPGGLGHVNCVTSIIFAGMSGAAVADIGGIGHLCYSEMVKSGYDKNFSGAVTMASSLIGPIIPPSIPVIIYSMCTGASTGKLLIAGLLPGVLMGVALMIWVCLMSIKRGYPYEKRVAVKIFFANLLGSFITGIPALLTPVILLVAIYTGVVTSTEAAGLAATYALILGFILYRTMTAKSFVDVFKSTFGKCSSVLMLVMAGKAFGFVLTNENVQKLLTDFCYALAGDSKYGILLICMIIYLILGCISDSTVNILLFSSMTASILAGVGFDPIHVGLMTILCAMLGNITPPVGSVIMGVCSLEGLKMHEVAKELIAPIGVLFLVLIVIAFVPGIVTFLPNLVMS